MIRRNRPTNSLRGFAQRNDGAAASEFALMLPLLVILLFAGVEIGRVLHDYHTVSKSVRDAGRYAARWHFACPDTVYTDPDVVANTRNLALTGRVSGDGDYLLALWDEPETVTVTLTCSDNGGWEGLYSETQVRSVNVRAEVPFEFLFASLLGLPGRLTLTLEHTQPHVGE